MKDGWFDRLGVFTFSREEGTPSYDMEDQVPMALAEERRAELMLAQQEIHIARNRERVGHTVEVLLDEVLLDGTATGRTQHDAPDADGVVKIRGIGTARVGAVVPIRITDVDGYDLIGEPVAHPAPETN